MSSHSIFAAALLAIATTTACSANRPNDGEGPDGAVGDAAPFTNGTSTLAGASDAAFKDGDRAVGRFSDPVNVAYGPDGRVYVADFYNSRIRAIDSAGNSSTVVVQDNFIRPFGLVFLPNGTLIASTDNDDNGVNNETSGSIWRIDIGAKTATVLANAIGRPRGLSALANGQVAMTDEFHHVVRTIDPNTGVISNLAGAWDSPGDVDAVGAAARFSTPYGMVTRPDGSLVVCDYDNNSLRIVGMDGSVTTMTGGAAGFADGGMSQAKFSHPQGIAIDGAGNIYVTDLDNYRVREVTNAGVTTIAGNGTPGYLDSDDNLSAELYGLEGLTITPDGSTLFVSDGNRGEDVPYNRIRQVKL